MLNKTFYIFEISPFLELFLIFLIMPLFTEIANNKSVMVNLILFIFLIFSFKCGIILIKMSIEFVGLSVLLVYSSVLPVLISFFLIFTDTRS